ncbi:MAG: hypothetical protein U5K38_04050 [Woeseiaceae bacterium]|nr:hypothetical protein [Woeseiaceae bacterium]
MGGESLRCRPADCVWSVGRRFTPSQRLFGDVRPRYMEPTYRTRPDLDVVLRDAATLGLGK